jgi:serine/threonine protein kinase
MHQRLKSFVSSKLKDRDKDKEKGKAKSESKGLRSLERFSSIFYGRDTGDIRDKYDIGEEVCRGACGTISHAVDKVTGKKYACKTVLKASMKTQEQLDDIRLESEIMLHLRGTKIWFCFKFLIVDGSVFNCSWYRPHTPLLGPLLVTFL